MAIPCFAQMPSSSTMLVLHLSTTRIFILYLFELKFLHRWIYSCLLHYVYLGFIPTTHVYLYNITIDYIVLNVYKQYNMHMRGIVWSQGQIQNFVLVCHMFKIKTTHWHLMHPVKIDFLAGNCCASDISFLKCDILAKKKALKREHKSSRKPVFQLTRRFGGTVSTKGWFVCRCLQWIRNLSTFCIFLSFCLAIQYPTRCATLLKQKYLRAIDVYKQNCSPTSL